MVLADAAAVESATIVASGRLPRAEHADRVTRSGEVSNHLETRWERVKGIDYYRKLAAAKV